MRNTQFVLLFIMLAVALALVFATFAVDTASAARKGPQPQGWWYQWRCTGCVYQTYQCPSQWMKICERWFCETVGGDVVCVYVGPTKSYCCN